jgi:hypothetical protein
MSIYAVILRIFLDPDRELPELLGALGHELQYALEVLASRAGGGQP